ncbi:MAG: PLP-dependent aminotransferase family protein [Aquabacterium sp.]|uniref:MocR-like pyridoxine biosynthesis transcription factor PdxR n=1 Tax=Aquabacterium sp. TaxID=1872578 RepID=UPI0025C3590D|nr:PLP-dependent aminotransferase family protein [Aquabacterium sp.]MBI5925916.1 PLP-dependent aminotransferase family protein [Aquabacterium sp.]
MADLHLLLDGKRLKAQAIKKRQALQRVLYEALRDAIAQGRLQAGAVLPSSRDLARDLAMARNGVIHAYEQLAAEGYVQPSRQGTVVAAFSAVSASRVRAPALLDATALVSQRVRQCDRRRLPEDDLRPFMPGMPALDAFPLPTWQRLCDRALRQGSTLDLGYRHAVGEPDLRQAIATYLRAARGVRCHADQVTITDGTQHSMELCAHILADVGDTVWIEHPGYGGARTAFVQAGLNVVPVTVDADGIAPPEAWWRDKPPRMIYTTPSHQYPLGAVLTLPRRLRLIEQARQAGAWILEDDYDSEFRHDGPPLAAMQGQVDDAPVVYLGTFSKSMFPALRLGFIVWPQALADRAAGVVGELVRRGRPFEQRALAAFIDEGHFTRHLRKMRKLYAERQAALREALARQWPLSGQVLGGQAGMHLVLSLPSEGPDAVQDTSLAHASYALGLSPRPLAMYGTGGVSGFNGLVMGYANTPQARMEGAVKRLVEALAVARLQR